MLFVSPQFVVFFLATTLACYALPARFRWAILLATSCLFYATFVPIYLLVLFFTIVVDFAAGLLIERSTGPRRRMWLLASIVANVGVLFVFKYYDFAARNLEAGAARLGHPWALPILSIVLPIGLSFHTFQAMSYTIEVYRGHQRAERHFGIYALYVMFFPQLVAGPIERPQNLLPQFRAAPSFDYARVTDGLRLMGCGALKKIVVADRLAVIADRVYDDPHLARGLSFVVATVAFTFQSYYDFAGYSDMARGAARVLGYELMLNFDRPFASRSMAEYWRRWHISLSTWFRDYVYFPLGGSRVPRMHVYLNVMIVFVLSGVWHGANWTFAVWGALNGAYLIIALACAKPFRALRDRLGIDRSPRAAHAYDVLSTFAIVAFASIFFRAASVTDGLTIARGCVAGVESALHGDLGLLRLGPRRIEMAVALVALVEWLSWLESRGELARRFDALPSWSRALVYQAAAVSIVLLGDAGERPFIYFQF